MRILLETYGCTFNQADSNAIAQALRKSGHSLAKSEQSAQAVIVNTCGVKNATENRVLHRLHQLAKKRKKTIATGCLAQATPERILAANPDASIVGTFSQSSFIEVVEATAREKPVRLLDRNGFLEQCPQVDGVTSTVQIARGCLGSCSFCQTKLARGGLESIPPKTILNACETAAAHGAKEIRLTAQDAGCYGLDCGTNLAELVEEITKIRGRFRVRVGMTNPEHCLKIMPALLKAFESNKVYKFLHVPLQSGSDGVLTTMKRGHSAKDFQRAVSLFRKKFPDAMIATDVIAGFPTESEADFEKTIKAIEEAQPDFANVSRYSPRPKTAAAAMKQLPDAVVGERTRKLSALCRRILVEKNHRRVGTKGIAVVTERAKNGWLARFENYVPILVDDGELGEFVSLRVKSAGNVACRGERI